MSSTMGPRKEWDVQAWTEEFDTIYRHAPNLTSCCRNDSRSIYCAFGGSRKEKRARVVSSIGCNQSHVLDKAKAVRRDYTAEDVIFLIRFGLSVNLY